MRRLLYFMKPRMISVDNHPFLEIWKLDHRKPTSWWQIWRRIAVHHFVDDEWSDTSHDHPFDFWTIILFGGYLETIERSNRSRYDVARRPGGFRFVKAEVRHTTKLLSKEDGCWTITFRSPERRAWGYWVDNKFIPWQKYFESHNVSPTTEEFLKG